MTCWSYVEQHFPHIPSIEVVDSAIRDNIKTADTLLREYADYYEESSLPCHDCVVLMNRSHAGVCIVGDDGEFYVKHYTKEAGEMCVPLRTIQTIYSNVRFFNVKK